MNKNISAIKILLHTKKHSNLLKNIVRHVGNLTSEDMEEVLNIFGDDFILGIKYWSGRKSCSLKKYFEMREKYLLLENNEIQQGIEETDDFEDNYLNIREAYICASDYDYLIDNEDEQKYKYSEDEKDKLKRLYLV
jgi:hypothetical protein